jgi:hypothetical protein
VQKFEQMPFNDVVVDTLEKLLAQARKGRMSFFAFSACEGSQNGYDGFVGEINSFYCGHYGLLHCAKRIMERLDQGIVDKNLAPAANLYCYDVMAEPVSHDFIAWLVNIKMMQAREGMSGPTKIWFSRNPGVEDFSDQDYRAGFFESVMVPAPLLFGMVQDPAAKNGRRVPCASYRPIVEAAKHGETVPRIAPPAALMVDMKSNLGGISPVVITLREHHYWTHRNSNLTDWLRFAEYLEARGEHVIFVRDYAHAEEDITGFETMPAASKNFLIRAALYEHAKCNLFVSNGPASLALFGCRPWLQFIDCHGGEEYLQNRPDWWWVNHGIKPGEQFPWSAPTQRIVWAPDSYQNMVEAWEENFPMVTADAA